MKPTLLVLAAGMGSRYGGLKQIDKLGPNGQTIIEYSVFDAIRAGFGKVVFVIRKDIEADFKEIILPKLTGKIAIELVFQELDKLPEGFVLPKDRVKPWGTAHAILMAKDAINEPFAAINADDFYGAEAYQTIADYLTSGTAASDENYCMVGYPVKNTLSDFGSVSRGVCEINDDDYLQNVVERFKIQKEEDSIVFFDDEKKYELDMNTLVSMNFWGFAPSIFTHLENKFVDFLKEKINVPKSEFLIPSVVDELIKDDEANVKVLSSDARWFGVTYKEDRPIVVEKIQELTKNGKYPDDF